MSSKARYREAFMTQGAELRTKESPHAIIAYDVVRLPQIQDV